MLGIVPDKLPGSVNYNLGWAHCYSLPREWSLDDKGNLIQKPYEGLKKARSEEKFTRNDFTLDGELDLAPIEGRQIELLGRFQVGTSPVGFKFFRSSGSEAVLKYIPAANMLTVDLTKLNRTANDNGSYNGLYTCVLPEKLAEGSELKINLFIDGSVIDIFVNDRWATSMRAFPTEADANGVTVFSDGPVKANEVSAWKLDAGSSGIGSVTIDSDFPFWGAGADGLVDVYNLGGTKVKSRVGSAEATDGLAPGIYIVNGRKIYVR